MNNNFLTFIVFLVFGLGCSPSAEEKGKEAIVIFDEKDLPPAIALKGKKYNFTEFLDPRRILCVGDFLVVSEKTNGNLLHILDIKSGKYFRSTGKNGLGSGEATYVAKLEQAFEKESFWSD